MSDVQINTVTDLIFAAANALNEKDTEALEGLVRIASDWLQPEYETQAQLAMLEAMMCAVEELADVA